MIMGPTRKRSFATRLPPESARLLEKEIAQSEKNQSEFLREILEGYIEEEIESGGELPPIGSVERILNDLEN